MVAYVVGSEEQPMAKFRIAAVNIENLFERAKALNLLDENQASQP